MYNLKCISLDRKLHDFGTDRNEEMKQ